LESFNENIPEFDHGETRGSLIRGSEILPSDRTRTNRLIASFFQTEMSSWSSGPHGHLDGGMAGGV